MESVSARLRAMRSAPALVVSCSQAGSSSPRRAGLSSGRRAAAEALRVGCVQDHELFHVGGSEPHEQLVSALADI